MAEQASGKPSHKISNWVNEHRQALRAYIGSWIAYNETGIVAHAESLDLLCQKADESGQQYWVFFVNPVYFEGIRFRAIHFRSITFHDWMPFYPIKLHFKDKSISLPMIIDSGADGSLISYDTGIKLGLQINEGETVQSAKGIGGGVIRYVWRDIQVSIDQHAITVPMAWILDGENQEEIIGRAVVFDAFDIEFKQKDEIIIFRRRIE